VRGSGNQEEHFIALLLEKVFFSAEFSTPRQKSFPIFISLFTLLFAAEDNSIRVKCKQSHSNSENIVVAAQAF
jgi:hypothetical protein